jgi:hypothetical protein
MHALKIATGLAALTLAAVALTGCIVEPGPYGGAYYAQPAPVYVGPSYYYGPRYRHWRGGGGWHHGGHHHWH